MVKRVGAKVVCSFKEYIFYTSEPTGYILLKLSLLTIEDSMKLTAQDILVVL